MLYLKEYQYLTLKHEIEISWNIELLRLLGIKIRALDYQPSNNSQRLSEMELEMKCYTFLQELDDTWRVLLIKEHNKYLSDNCRKTYSELKALYDQWNQMRKKMDYTMIRDDDKDDVNDENGRHHDEEDVEVESDDSRR